MIRKIVKFKDDVLSYLEELEGKPDIDRGETLGQFTKSHGNSELFQKAYLIPICGAIWSCSSEGVMNFSAYSILSFCRNHHLLQESNPAAWSAWNFLERWITEFALHIGSRSSRILRRPGCLSW